MQNLLGTRDLNYSFFALIVLTCILLSSCSRSKGPSANTAAESCAADEFAASHNERVVGVWVGGAFGERLKLECKANGGLIVLWNKQKPLLGTWSVFDGKVELIYGNDGETSNRASGIVSGDRLSLIHISEPTRPY